MGKKLSKTIRVSEELHSGDSIDNNHPDIKQFTEKLVDIYEIDAEKVEKVPCKDKPIKFKIVKVYDGDTVHVVILLGQEPLRLSIRISGIDTPELKSKNEKEKLAAQKCKSELESYIYSEDCRLVIRAWDKYGNRVIGDFYIRENGEKISDIMIKRGFGRIYNGKKKVEWTDEELDTIISL